MRILFYAAMHRSIRGAWDSPQKLGLGYLASYLRRRLPDVEMRLAQTEDDLYAEPFDLIGITTVTYTYREARRTAREVKERTGALVVLGGPHLTGLPDRMDREFDYGVVGEGEETFAELVKRLQASNPPEGLESIPGLIYWKNEERVVNPPRPLIADLDSLPFPDRDLCGGAAVLRGNVASVITSRGCPYKCRFCTTATLMPGYRQHSADYIVSEIAEIADKYQPREIRFDDDLFIANRARLENVAGGILSRGIHKKTRFYVSGRANHLGDDLCRLLRSFNTQTVFIGLESASDKVLQSMCKDGVSAEKNQWAVDNVRRNGMKVNGNFIFGIPGETRDDVYETYQFIHKNLDAFNYLRGGPLCLFPRSPFWQDAEKLGLIDEDLTGIALTDEEIQDGWKWYSTTYPMLCDTMTRGELLGFILVFEELWRVVNERGAKDAYAREIEDLRRYDVRALRIKSTASALARKILNRLGLGQR